MVCIMIFWINCLLIDFFCLSFFCFFCNFDVSHDMQDQMLLRDASPRSSTLSRLGSLDLFVTCATSVVLFSINMRNSVLQGDLFLHYCLCS